MGNFFLLFSSSALERNFQFFAPTLFYRRPTVGEGCPRANGKEEEEARGEPKRRGRSRGREREREAEEEGEGGCVWVQRKVGDEFKKQRAWRT